MYEAGLVVPDSAIAYRRTPEERADATLSWRRADRAFFAAGACHILAFRMLERWTHAKLDMIYIRPVGRGPGHHVYVSDGWRAFDFNGWSREADLLDVNAARCRLEDPDWTCERLIVTDDLLRFCSRYGHRPPGEFPGDVVARADCFLDGIVDWAAGGAFYTGSPSPQELCHRCLHSDDLGDFDG